MSGVIQFGVANGRDQQVTAANPLPVGASSLGGASMATGQVAVPATPTDAVQVVAARAGRSSVTLTPLTSVAYTVGNSGVTVATGMFVPAGQSVTLETAAAVYAVGASAVTLSYLENY